MMQSNPNPGPKREVTVVLSTEQEGQEHLFGFICTPETSTQILRELGKMAMNPELPFEFSDAVEVGKQIRRQVYDVQHPPKVSAEGPKDLPPRMRRG
jgi:hypothetical protein